MPRTVSQTINLQTPDQTGKYITDISSSNGIQIHAINNVGSNYTQIDSNGLTVYNGGINVAQFGSIAQIGNVNNTHIQMDYRSLRLIDKEGNAYLYISDLRDKNDNNYATITETFVGNGSTKTFNVQLEVDVEVSATDSSDSTNLANRLGDTYTFTTAPADGATITIVYKTASSMAKAYTFGQRSNSGQIGAMSIAEGYNTVASGYISHAEGSGTIANGFASHAEGSSTTASSFAHAEGYNTTASTTCAHAEGNSTIASGYTSHAEGYLTTASRNGAHAEGYLTTASGLFSHSQNRGTIAKCKSQTALGEYNIADTSIYESIRGNYAIIVGNGTADDARSNALTVDWNGRIQCGNHAGTLTSIFDIFYPVGSYYETSDSTFDPNTSLGGTWSSEEILDDEIVEEGTTDIWTYRKWKSGISECWGMHTFTLSIRNAYGNGPVYYGQYTSLFPSNLFISEPVVTVTRQGREGAGLIHISPYSVSATQASYFVANTSAVYPNAPLGVSFEVKGLWKTYSAPTTKYRWHRTA